MRHEFEKYCTEPEKIENYERAKKDNFKGWHCHHRLETHNSDGERRPVDITYKELMALNMYYHRPAEELIFLPRSEHEAFRKGKPRSAETRRKMKGNKNALGYHHSEETRKRMSEAHKGKKFTEEHKKKLSAVRKGNTNTKGMRWFNNGKINTMAKECPNGFVPGRLKGEQNLY